jgi:hypothetical protein
MITLISRGTTFKIKVTKKESNSNYNVWAHIFKPTDEMPIAGTSFKENTQASEIIEWAKNTLNNFDNNFLTK